MLGSPAGSVAPDFIEPFTGWRYWAVADGKIVSPQIRSVWEGGQLTWDGLCRCGALQPMPEGTRRLLSAPRAVGRLLGAARCRCGINAWGDRETALTSELRAYRTPAAVGEVALWGHVEQYETGYRAEHAQIRQLWATSEDTAASVEAAAQAAGVSYAGILTPHPGRWRFAQPQAWVWLIAALAALTAGDWATGQASVHGAGEVGVDILAIGAGGVLTLRAIKPLYWALGTPIFYVLLVAAAVIVHLLRAS